MTIADTARLDGLFTLLKKVGYAGTQEDLDAFVRRDEFKGIEPVKLRNAILSHVTDAVDKIKQAYKTQHGENVALLHVGFKDLQVEDVKSIATHVEATPLTTTGEATNRLRADVKRREAAARTTKSVTNETKEAGFWDRFKSGEYDKVNLAVGLVAAGLSAFGALQSATQIMSKDEQGRDHVNMSPLLWTLGQGAMAAGIAYLTLKAPQLTSAAARV